MNNANIQLSLSLRQLLRSSRPTSEAPDVMQCTVSPIRHLPFEILARIILLASEAYSSTTNWVITSQAGPWGFGQVCASWRAVVLTTSALWQNINLETFRSTLKHRDSHSIFLLTEALRRSGAYALNIKFKYKHPSLNDEDDDDEQDDCDPLLITLTSMSHRWQTFSFDVCENVEELMELNEQLRGRSLAALRSLDLHAYRQLDPFNEPLDFMRLAPLLNRLHLGMTPKCVYIPWLQLEHITIKVKFETDLINVLRNAKNLKSLACQAPYPWRSDSPMPEHTLQSSVQELQMSSGRLLDFITLPNLQKLHLVIFDPSETPSEQPRLITYVMPFLVRSGCQLATLVLEYTNFTVAEVATILRALPSLSTLTISKLPPFFYVEVLLTKLGRDGGALIPNLRHLYIYGLRWRCLEPLLGLLETRTVPREDRIAVSALEQVVLTGRFASYQAMHAILAYLQGPDSRIPDRSWSYDYDSRELKYQHSSSLY
ncbi:hypothetical protein HGRIS_003016 [Hohenbuehelia grisea]|uniref:F-box domain-containing protein n=1 Tax=Hohenbuehelia grisea TaxID=104357 RepID=A0ABR3JNK7_9AGAR